MKNNILTTFTIIFFIVICGCAIRADHSKPGVDVAQMVNIPCENIKAILVAHTLTTLTNIQVSFTEATLGNQPVSVPKIAVSVSTFLDLICVQIGGKWKIENKMVVIFK